MQIKNLSLVATALFISALFAFTFFAVEEYDSYKNSQLPLAERNYKAEINLGITPNMEARNPTLEDVDTKLNLQTTNGQTFRLFESRDFLTYGKTFVVPTN